jgi:acid phosphatase (class A)
VNQHAIAALACLALVVGFIEVKIPAGPIVAWSASTPEAAPSPEAKAPLRPELRGRVAGFLPEDAVIDSAALLPSPPQPGTPQMAADEAARVAALAFKDTARWRLAIRDADLSYPNGMSAFACALGVAISETDTPHLMSLLRRSLANAAQAVSKAKDKYNRTRPFRVVAGTAVCSPNESKNPEKDGSYPSAHTTIGWTWALTLMEVRPDRADVLARRGLAYGDSRIICNAHWQSDVNAGRIIAAAVFAQLQPIPEYRAEIEAARAEVALQIARGARGAPDCTLETEALGH